MFYQMNILSVALLTFFGALQLRANTKAESMQTCQKIIDITEAITHCGILDDACPSESVAKNALESSRENVKQCSQEVIVALDNLDAIYNDEVIPKIKKKIEGRKITYEVKDNPFLALYVSEKETEALDSERTRTAFYRKTGYLNDLRKMMERDGSSLSIHYKILLERYVEISSNVLAIQSLSGNNENKKKNIFSLIYNQRIDYDSRGPRELRNYLETIKRLKDLSRRLTLPHNQIAEEVSEKIYSENVRLPLRSVFEDSVYSETCSYRRKGELYTLPLMESIYTGWDSQLKIFNGSVKRKLETGKSFTLNCDTRKTYFDKETATLHLKFTAGKVAKNTTKRGRNDRLADPSKARDAVSDLISFLENSQ